MRRRLKYWLRLVKYWLRLAVRSSGPTLLFWAVWIWLDIHGGHPAPWMWLLRAGESAALLGLATFLVHRLRLKDAVHLLQYPRLTPPQNVRVFLASGDVIPVECVHVAYVGPFPVWEVATPMPAGDPVLQIRGERGPDGAVVVCPRSKSAPPSPASGLGHPTL